MIVTLDEFNTYSGNMESSESVAAMKESMLMASQEVVSDYLGYSVESKQYDDYLSPIGQPVLYLNAYPVSRILNLSLCGSDIPASDYTIGGRGIRLNSGVWPTGIDTVYCSYVAGWSASDVPENVKMTILQIASLMLEESGGNIGITGKTMAENSRTFVNYTNYDKWLKKLDPLRIVRLV